MYAGTCLGSNILPIINIRKMSTSSGKNPVKTYHNPDEERDLIISENRGLSGVYRWVKKDSEKSYIGSSAKLNDRFRRYFNNSYISDNKRGGSLICKALLRYGYVGFRLEILEYCSSSEVLAREQFYLDTLKPEYNILKVAGSNLGYKHSEASLKLMSIASKTRNQSEEFLESKREVMLGRKLTKVQLDNMAINNPFRQSVVVSNIQTGDSQQFTSLTQAAEFLGVHMTTVKRYLNSSSPYKDYIITIVNSELDSTSSPVPTNVRQAVLLTNKETGDSLQLPTMKAACDYLGVSFRRLSNHINESSATNEQIDTIKGYVITKEDTDDAVKYNSTAIEITNIQTNEVTQYPSVKLAAEAIGASASSISTYLFRGRSTPYKNKYIFKSI